MDFFRFPRTPHLAWLGEGRPRGDKILSQAEARRLLAHDVVVEEKIDGANIGFSVDDEGQLRVQNRGQYLVRERAHPQFKPLFQWLERRQDDLVDALMPDLLLFGEWCYAVHSIRYSRLPDWFLAFDLYDRRARKFWSISRRDRLLDRLGLDRVPKLGAGRFRLQGLKLMLRQSRLAEGPPEGIYVRHDEGDWLAGRAKLVGPEFGQGIDKHWSGRRMQLNALAPAVGRVFGAHSRGDSRHTT